MRFSLGSSIEDSVLACLENLIMAKNAPKAIKLGYLIKAASLVEIITYKLRIFLDLKLANETKVFQIQSKLLEVGRMAGGWLKATQST